MNDNFFSSFFFFFLFLQSCKLHLFLFLNDWKISEKSTFHSSYCVSQFFNMMPCSSFDLNFYIYFKIHPEEKYRLIKYFFRDCNFANTARKLF